MQISEDSQPSASTICNSSGIKVESLKLKVESSKLKVKAERFKVEDEKLKAESRKQSIQTYYNETNSERITSPHCSKYIVTQGIPREDIEKM